MMRRSIRTPFAKLVPSIVGILVGIAVITAGFFTWRVLLPARVGRNTKIVVIFKSTDPSIVFWQIVEAGVRTASKELGVDVRVMGPKEEKDVNAQIEMLDRVAREHPAAIVLAADDQDALVPAAERVRASGIKLITIDSGLAGDISSSFIATDNEAAAEKAGRLTVRLLRRRGSVAIISYVKGTTTAIQRELGVKRVLERYPGIRLIGTYYSQDLANEAYRITRDLLTRRHDVDALIALNEVATVGAANALADLHLKDKVDLIGFDNSPIEIRYLESGVVKGIVLQKPFNIGYLGVSTAVKLLKGERVPRRIDTGSLLVTRENMFGRESQKLLFPLINGKE